MHARAARANGRRRSVHATKRRPARRAARRNPPGVKMSDAVEMVRYRHVQSRAHAPYQHKFGGGVEMWAQPDGTVLLRSKYGFRLHDEFTVRDSE